MAKIQFHGFLIEDPKFHVMDNGSKIANIVVSAKSEHPDARKKTPAERQLWDVSVFLTAQNKLGDYLKKGTNVSVWGAVYKDTYKEKTYVKIRANAGDVELLPSGRKPEGTKPAAPSEAPVEDDWDGGD